MLLIDVLWVGTRATAIALMSAIGVVSIAALLHGFKHGDKQLAFYGLAVSYFAIRIYFAAWKQLIEHYKERP